MILEAIKVGLVELSNFDLGELDFSFVVLDDIFDFMLELIVVFFDKLKSVLFVGLGAAVEFQQPFDFLVFGVDDVFEEGDVVVVVLREVGLSLVVGLSFL